MDRNEQNSDDEHAVSQTSTVVGLGWWMSQKPQDEGAMIDHSAV